MVNAVEKFKKKIKHKNVSANTKRSNITSFIAKQKSRQEFVPLVAELVDREHYRQGNTRIKSTLQIFIVVTGYSSVLILQCGLWDVLFQFTPKK